MAPLEIAFRFSTSVDNMEALGNGHINDTYLATTAENRFVLQKINSRVFPRPELIMANLEVFNLPVEQAETDGIMLKIPKLIPTVSGQFCTLDDQGEYWRALTYIENSESLETISHLSQAEQVGLALGQFHRITRNLDSTSLYDTLPGFHIAPNYMAQYRQIEQQSTVKKDFYCQSVIAGFGNRVNDLESAKEKGLLTVRTIHGDPKLNNFLFDKDSGRIISVVDLDTVKPGLIHYDIGDCIRSSCLAVNGEFDLTVCSTLLKAYLNEMGAAFTKSDFELLYPAIRLLPFELGLRFYTDYLDGNRYFKVTDIDDNLNRAIGQFRLCENVMAQEAEIRAVISPHFDSN